MLVNTGLRRSTHSYGDYSMMSTVPWAPSLKMYADLQKCRTLKHINGSQPVFKLPVEILCDIFLKTLEEGKRLSSSEERRPGVFVSLNCIFNPVILTQVCSAWRSIALDFPALWSRIYILDTSICRIRPLRRWLLRSKGSPLRIQVQGPIASSRETSYQMLSLIFAYSSCWRSIEFDIGFWSVEPILHLVCISEPCNALASAVYCIPELHTQPCPISLVQPVQEIAAFIHSSPVLQKTTWYHDVVGIPTPTFRQLRSLDIWFRIDAENLLGVLVEMPNIQYLQVRKWEVPSRTINPLLHPVVLHKLQELTIRVDHRMDPFFCNVTFPSLRNMEIIYQGCDRPYHPLLFQDFFRRSGCSLDRLKLCGKGPENSVEEILTTPAVQNLTTLHVKWSWISDRVAELLICDRSHALMPKLQSLTLSKCRVRDGMVSALLSSRWHMALGATSAVTFPGTLRRAMVYCTPRGPLDSTFLKENADDIDLACLPYE